ncbi:competence type IV pilus major pilin ComGC [Metabacillus arenae]|uniref:ComG operon protein 3 n=1 Tax=Metabacillus arenae TaxID=2771434 RepID=A0A926NCS4_9BACI|nr:competence type IV pilus major pilin ComGC [Metabacillus arenae]MBD1378836.1 prepilin-type N-terminal cleavage/methylation domain-containing protein [Metabacillus arenae]
MNNEKGFTLIEMLIVLFVISILLLITIPNVTKHHANIQEKGCDGLVNMIQGQAEAFRMNEDKEPTLAEMQTEDYIKESAPKCPNGKAITITNGVVGIAP